MVKLTSDLWRFHRFGLMLYKNVNIDCVAYELPPLMVTSEEIEAKLAPVYQRLKLPQGRLELMTGIKSRRLWQPNIMPSSAAAMAGRKALAQTSISKNDIGCLINCSVCRDFLEPATATVIHHELELPETAVAFDISNACLGILTGINVIAAMIEAGQINAGMLVSGENSRPLMETTISKILNDHTLTRQSIKPLFASLTIGSGAIAVMVCRRGMGAHDHRLIGADSLSVTRHNTLCRGNADKGMGDNNDTLMNTDSEMLLQCGIDAATITWDKFLASTGITREQISCYCTHQVGTVHRKMLYERLKIDIERDFSTLETFGNTGSVSCPLTTAIAVETGKVLPGDIVALLGIGSGINCTMLGVKW